MLPELTPAYFNCPKADVHKPSFEIVPPALREQIDALLMEQGHGGLAGGTPVFGGYSASATFRLTGKNGTFFFCKGAHPADVSHATQTIRGEIEAYSKVSAIKKYGPAFIGSVSDGGEDGWHLAVWEWVDNCQDPYADPLSLDVFFADLKSAPASNLILACHHNYIGKILSADGKWKDMTQDVRVMSGFISLFQEPAAGEAWCVNNLPVLQDLQNRQAAMEHEAGLMHGDLHAEHILGFGDRLFVIDWANACYGPLLFDQIFLAASLRARGLGARADNLLQRTETASRSVMTATLAGYFARQAYRVVPPAMPRLRWMQKSMLLGLLADLARFGIIDSIPALKEQRTTA